jgi:cell wall-associated NlpC family hydrolase
LRRHRSGWSRAIAIPAALAIAALAGGSASALAQTGGSPAPGSPTTSTSTTQPTSGVATLAPDGTAVPPVDAPRAVRKAINAGNRIHTYPYIWGGGHNRKFKGRGYDCSGAVSYALAGGGFLSAPLTSSQLESWGAAGPGKWLTVYANAGHTYAVIAGLRWDTVGDAQGSGPRWHPALPYPHGFTVRHPPGY